jgi:hypothetical protein
MSKIFITVELYLISLLKKAVDDVWITPTILLQPQELSAFSGFMPIFFVNS